MTGSRGPDPRPSYGDGRIWVRRSLFRSDGHATGSAPGTRDSLGAMEKLYSTSHLRDLDRPALQALCKKHGLRAMGTRDALVRLLERQVIPAHEAIKKEMSQRKPANDKTKSRPPTRRSPRNIPMSSSADNAASQDSKMAVDMTDVVLAAVGNNDASGAVATDALRALRASNSTAASRTVAPALPPSLPTPATQSQALQPSVQQDEDGVKHESKDAGPMRSLRASNRASPIARPPSRRAVASPSPTVMPEAQAPASSTDVVPQQPVAKPEIIEIKDEVEVKNQVQQDEDGVKHESKDAGSSRSLRASNRASSITRPASRRAMAPPSSTVTPALQAPASSSDGLQPVVPQRPAESVLEKPEIIEIKNEVEVNNQVQHSGVSEDHSPTGPVRTVRASTRIARPVARRAVGPLLVPSSPMPAAQDPTPSHDNVQPVIVVENSPVVDVKNGVELKKEPTGVYKPTLRGMPPPDRPPTPWGDPESLPQIHRPKAQRPQVRRNFPELEYPSLVGFYARQEMRLQASLACASHDPARAQTPEPEERLGSGTVTPPAPAENILMAEGEWAEFERMLADATFEVQIEQAASSMVRKLKPGHGKTPAQLHLRDPRQRYIALDRSRGIKRMYRQLWRRVMRTHAALWNAAHPDRPFVLPPLPRELRPEEGEEPDPEDDHELFSQVYHDCIKVDKLSPPCIMEAAKLLLGKVDPSELARVTDVQDPYEDVPLPLPAPPAPVPAPAPAVEALADETEQDADGEEQAEQDAGTDDEDEDADASGDDEDDEDMEEVECKPDPELEEQLKREAAEAKLIKEKTEALKKMREEEMPKFKRFVRHYTTLGAPQPDPNARPRRPFPRGDLPLDLDAISAPPRPPHMMALNISTRGMSEADAFSLFLDKGDGAARERGEDDEDDEDDLDDDEMDLEDEDDDFDECNEDDMEDPAQVFERFDFNSAPVSQANFGNVAQQDFGNVVQQPVFDSGVAQADFVNAAQADFNNAAQADFSNVAQADFDNGVVQPVFNNDAAQQIFNNDAAQPDFTNTVAGPSHGTIDPNNLFVMEHFSNASDGGVQHTQSVLAHGQIDQAVFAGGSAPTPQELIAQQQMQQQQQQQQQDLGVFVNVDGNAFANTDWSAFGAGWDMMEASASSSSPSTPSMTFDSGPSSPFDSPSSFDALDFSGDTPMDVDVAQIITPEALQSLAAEWENGGGLVDFGACAVSPQEQAQMQMPLLPYEPERWPPVRPPGSSHAYDAQSLHLWREYACGYLPFARPLLSDHLMPKYPFGRRPFCPVVEPMYRARERSLGAWVRDLMWLVQLPQTQPSSMLGRREGKRSRSNSGSRRAHAHAQARFHPYARGGAELKN